MHAARWIGAAGLSLLLLAGTAARAGDSREAGGPARARLGMTEAQLRALHGTTLRAEKIVAPAEQASPIPARLTLPKKTGTSGQAPAPPPADPYVNQARLVRTPGEGDVVAEEYLLHKGRVYRIRWTLADRFEQPIMSDLVEQGTKRFGEPAYDQNIVQRPGSAKANLRRSAWVRGARSLEIRQLNPIMGGPLYVTLSDGAAIKAIVRDGGTVAPEPETAGSWWLAKQRKPRLPTPEERAALEGALWKIVERSGF
jgi:hypothetical protein